MVLETIRRRTIRRSGPNPALDGGTGPLSWWDWPSVVRPAVNDKSALSLAPFYRGIMIIAGTIGGLPIQVFEEEIDAQGNEGQTRKIKSANTAFLWRRPNHWQTMQAFWERIVADLVRGNAFIFVVKTATGRVAQERDVPAGKPWGIYHIARNRVQVGLTSDRQKAYLIDDHDPMIDFRQGGEIVHIPNWGDDIIGYDPIKIAPMAIANGLSAEEYAAQAFGTGQIPPGILSSDMELTTEQADAIKARWREMHGGVANSQDIGVLGNGARFQAITRNLEEMQNTEARKLTASQVACLLGLPPFMLGDMDHASQGGGNGLEEQNRQLTTFNFNGHINRIQQAVSDDLLGRATTNRYMRMATGGLLRGNTLQRYQAYRIADFMTINEKRALEELEPVDGGDVVLAMTNMVPLEDLGAEEEEPEEEPAFAMVRVSRNGNGAKP